MADQSARMRDPRALDVDAIGRADVVGAEAARGGLLAGVLGDADQRRARRGLAHRREREQPDRARADDRDVLARLDVGDRARRAARTRAARPARRPRRTRSSGTVCSCDACATRPSLQPPPVSRQKPVCSPAERSPSVDVAAQRGQALRALGARRRGRARRSRARAGRRRARRAAGPRRSRPRSRGRGRTGCDVSVARCSEALPVTQREVGAADAGEARADRQPVRAGRARRADLAPAPARPRRAGPARRARRTWRCVGV